MVICTFIMPYEIFSINQTQTKQNQNPISPCYSEAFCQNEIKISDILSEIPIENSDTMYEYRNFYVESREEEVPRILNNTPVDLPAGCTVFRKRNKYITINGPVTVITRDNLESCGYVEVVERPPELQSGETEQNVGFADEESGSSESFISMSENNSLGDDTPSIPLGDFLARPVLIKEVTWAQTDGVQLALDTVRPWKAFFNDTAIKKKVDNYAFVRCNLKLKIVVNASPFYYGCMQASYTPLPNFKTDTNNTGYSGEVALVAPSQRHSVFIYPHNNQGGEITLPFFYVKNWLAVTSSSDLEHMGQIDFNIFNQLQSANGAVGASLTVQVFAWAEDIEVMGPTHALAVQSGEVDSALSKPKDEFDTAGKISKPASAIAVATGLLGEIPIIGPFMTATSMAATAVGNIAHLFGYTNVPHIGAVEAVKHQPFAHMSSPEISTSIERLCLDPKNELTIDNRIMGLGGEDALAMKNLVTRDTFIANATFSTTNAEGDALISALVNPLFARNQTVASVTGYNMSALSYISGPFEYWRGDIIFTFKIIASQYHKGRLRFHFDPTSNIAADGAKEHITTTFTKIIDIGQSNTVEFIVPYMQATSWLKCYKLTDTNLASTRYREDGLGFAPDKLYDNGSISVKVMTNLTAPVATSSVDIQMWVRGGDNFEFAQPRELEQRLTALTVQSGELDPDAIDSFVAGSGSNKKHPCRYLVNMGEAITSLRQLLRRHQFIEGLNCGTPAILSYNRLYQIRSSVMPKFYGYDANGNSSAEKSLAPGTYAQFNYVTNCNINWIGNLFVGYRGSVNWKFNLNKATPDQVCHFNVVRNAAPITVAATHTITTSTNDNNLDRVCLTGANRSMGTGASLTNTLDQPSLEVNIPMYNMFKFCTSQPSSRILGNSYDGSDVHNMQISLATTGTTTGSHSVGEILETYCAIGPDFDFLYYLSTPTVYYLATPAAQ